jgi:hypothetical protein
MNKETTITIRCTQKQKEVIARNSNKKNLSISKYVLNCCLNKRKTYRTQSDKKISEALVFVQRDLNYLERIAKYCGPYSENINKAVQDIKEKEEIIWRNSLR